MRPFRSLLYLLILIVLASAAGGQPFADRLPASTLVYTGWSPNDSLRATRAAKMLADPRLARPWRAVLERLLVAMPGDVGGGEAGGAGVAEHLPQLVSEAAQCDGCFALLDLRPAKGDLIPQAILLLDLGAHRPVFEQHFNPIQAKLKDRLGERLRMTRIGEAWLWSRADHNRAQYTWGFLAGAGKAGGDLFILYLGDAAERFIPTLAAAAHKQLKDAPEFVEAMAHLPAAPSPSVLTTYVDIRAALALARTLVKDSNDDGLRTLANAWHKMTVELGLDNVRSLGQRTSIDDGRFVTRSLLRTEGPPHGLITAFVRPAVDDAMLKAVPPDATFVAAGRLDLGKTYEQVKSAAIAVAGDDGRRAFGDVEDAAAGAGLPVERLLGPLGEQWVVYEAASTGGLLFTGLTLIVDVRDADRLGGVLTVLQQLLSARFHPEERALPASLDADGVIVHYIDASRGFNLVSPAWAVTEHRLIVALYPQVVEDAIRQFHAERSILDHPPFTQAREQSGGGGPLLYFAGPEFIRGVYPVALPFVSAFGGLTGIDTVGAAAILPSLQRLLPYFGADIASTRLTPDGIARTTSVANPLISPLTLVDAVPLWVAFALPSLGGARVNADRTASALNLRQLGQGISLYANDNAGRLPPDFTAVLKSEGLNPATLHSPFSTAATSTDYPYLRPDAPAKSIPPDILLAYDAAELATGDGANVLYADGHVEWLDRAAVTAALDHAKKWRDEHPWDPLESTCRHASLSIL